MKLWYALRCWVGRPSCYRKYMQDGSWWFAICKHCGRQAEVHDGRLLSKD